jgi:hypothetical protein
MAETNRRLSIAKTKRPLINSASEIPQHSVSEDVERERWALHDFSDAFHDESSERLEIANLELSVIRLQDLVNQLTSEN